MGANSSKVHDTVDFGSVIPNGLYPTAEQAYDSQELLKLIKARKIAPFYKGLADEPELVDKISIDKTNRDDPFLDKMRQLLYSNAVECPICFLFYPANINYARCCDQPICTECFIQIHRPLDNTPATCPFCMEENFGILYKPPCWSEARSRYGSHNTRHTTSGIEGSYEPRRESVDYKNPDVVLVDHIRVTTRPRSSSTVSAGRSRLLRATRAGRSASLAATNTLNIEDWMVMEAIRLSLAEQEATKRATTENPASNNNSINL